MKPTVSLFSLKTQLVKIFTCSQKLTPYIIFNLFHCKLRPDIASLLLWDGGIYIYLLYHYMLIMIFLQFDWIKQAS